MRLFKFFLSLSLIFSTLYAVSLKSNSPSKLLNDRKQLLVVFSSSIDSQNALLQRYEKSKSDTSWKKVGEVMNVTLGKAGFAWGTGLHHQILKQPQKKEGDFRSPAGIFNIGVAFGTLAKKDINLNIDYIQLTPYFEAIDDSDSLYYNSIVDTKDIIKKDWKSSEIMSKIPEYAIGFTIEHNFPNTKPFAGSAIFFQIWKNPQSPTAGSTATSYRNVMKILRWLDSKKKPFIVQMPLSNYLEIRKAYKLPKIDKDILELSKS